MVTHLGIIHKGSLIFEGKLEDLLQHHQIKSSLLIHTNDNTKATAVLQKSYHVSHNPKGLMEVTIDNSGEADLINKTLIKNEIDVLQLQLLNADLETIYLQLTKI